MNDEESKELIRHIIDCDPDVNRWLMTNSPRPLNTLKIWQRCLSQVPFAVAKSVVDAIYNGRLPPLEPYHRARTAIYIVELARERLRHQQQDVELLQRRLAFKQRKQQRQRLPAFPAGSG